MTSTIRLCFVSLSLFALVFTGCEGPAIIVGEELTTLPDLSFAGVKGDNATTNTTLGEPLKPGAAFSGKNAGYMAFPMSVEAGESIPIQAWTSESSVVFVYGPREGGRWDFEQMRAFSKGVQPGVETRRIDFEAPESGEYLMVVGGANERASEWIVARGVVRSE